jgi:hypothetical protein
MRFESRTVDAPAGTERIGAIACWAFGIAWAIWGLTGIAGGPARIVVGIVALALAGATAVVVFRGDGSSRPRRLPADWQRRYNLLVLAEFVVIFLASLALGRTGHAELIPMAICLIVGLHFLPLAGLFDMPTYRWTAIALCLVAFAGAGLITVTGADAVRAVVGFGAAVVLWASAAIPSHYPSRG